LPRETTVITEEDTNETYFKLNLKPGDHLHNIGECRKQLLHYQKKHKDTGYIRRDIEGYDLILKSGSQKTAGNFFKLKGDIGGSKDKDNLYFIDLLKKNGGWHES